VIGQTELLSGRYVVGDVIGRGGMGIVYRAWDTELERPVAVKILRALAPHPADRERFRIEGRFLARLNHPQLITLFDAGTKDEQPYLVMELVDGESLAEVFRAGPMRLDDVAQLGAALAETLAYVHRQEIVHRDLKPGNVLLTSDGRVKLADFGIARLIGEVGHHTSSGVAIGSAAYLSPEQVRLEPVSGASDVYSLGLVLIEALAGQPVFVGPPTEVALARLTRSPMVDPDWPKRIRDLLSAMTATVPEHRPNADQVAYALRTWRSGGVAQTQPIPVEPPQLVPPPHPAARPAARPPVRPGIRRGATQPLNLPRHRHGRPFLIAVLAVGLVLAGLLFHRPGSAAAPSSDSPSGRGPAGVGEPLKDSVNQAKHDAIAKAQAELRKQQLAAQKSAKNAAQKAADATQKWITEQIDAAADAAVDGAKNAVEDTARRLKDAVVGDDSDQARR
jgi:serine/threonine protein kinase